MQGKARICFAVILLAGHFAIANADQSRTARDFEEGVTLLELRRDYEAAARIFEVLARDADRSLAARSLIYLGTCYDRLGDDRALSTYQRVLADYSEQSEAVKAARSRISALGAGTLPHRLTRPLWGRERPRGVVGRPSYGGQVIASIDGESVSLLDLETGLRRGPLHRLPADPGGAVCLPTQTPSAMSPDGTSLVITCEQGRLTEFRLVSTAAGAPSRTIHRLGPGEAATILEWTQPTSVLALITTAQHVSRLITVDMAGKPVRTVAEVPSGMLGASLSPDGKWIAFDGPARPESRDRAIWVAPAGGGPTRAAIGIPMNDRFPHWLPDGSGIVFATERTGTPGVWLQRLENGVPRGAPRQLTPNIGAIVAPLGLTRAGRLVYFAETGLVDTYLVRLDEEGTPRGEPGGLATRAVGQNRMPAWSPDQKRVAFIDAARGVVVHELATRHESVFAAGLVSPTQPRFSPDGSRILVRAWNSSHQHGFFLIDTSTSTVSTIRLFSPEDESVVSPARWSSDGQSVIFALRNQLWRLDIQSSLERPLHSVDAAFRIMAPDVSWTDDSIVFVQAGKNAMALVRLDSSGTLSSLYSARTGEVIAMPVWIPGNAGVLFSRRVPGTDGTVAPGLWRLDLDTKRLRELRVDGNNARDPAVSADGRFLAFTAGSASREIYVLENFLPSAGPARRR